MSLPHRPFLLYVCIYVNVCVSWFKAQLQTFIQLTHILNNPHTDTKANNELLPHMVTVNLYGLAYLSGH